MASARAVEGSNDVKHIASSLVFLALSELKTYSLFHSPPWPGNVKAESMVIHVHASKFLKNHKF